ncbi:ornithine transcarbamylase [Paratrimastix pyriformis]|uniref:ornithine carbamoyltransferase n=1 Tax=Paratrimastix pyriformis TaxID=342808 RepID=A0ABQ8UXT3_9EUKA|nr:ornithine transcarbamylase [Paratrimastix pyriformis]
MPRHLTKISDLSKEEILRIIEGARNIKAHPLAYAERLKNKTLLMLFEKPSLRTRVSFEVGMTQMGGHAIFYSVADSPLGKKESIEDTAKVLSRFVDVVMARVNTRKTVQELAANSAIPIINALDDFAHPCQMLCDLQTIVEKRGTLEGLKMAYCGDLHNNVTYDLMRSAAVMGFDMSVAGPSGPGFEVEPEVLEECQRLCAVSGGHVRVCATSQEACRGVDVIYADSWMSYGISKDQLQERINRFMPFQINEALLQVAKPDVIFMNCLPAARGMEQTAGVIDGPHSIVFDQAENRLHAQKSLLLFLLGQPLLD